MESDIYLSTFTLTPSCRLFYVFLLLFLHSSSIICIACKMREKNPNKQEQLGCLLKKLQEIKIHDRKGLVSNRFYAFKLIHLYISAPFFLIVNSKNLQRVSLRITMRWSRGNDITSWMECFGLLLFSHKSRCKLMWCFC